jgi:ribosomal protein S18 acetylase RimI-like enzyme
MAGEEEFVTTGLPSSVLVRRAEPQDLAALARLLVDCFELYPLQQSWMAPIVGVGIQLDLSQRLLGQQYACLLAETATGEIVGTIEVSYRQPLPWQWNEPPYPYLANLAVSPEQRQQGVASRLLTAAELIVAGWGYAGVSLHVMSDNQAALGLYQRSGYEFVREEFAIGGLFGGAKRWLLRKPFD